MSRTNWNCSQCQRDALYRHPSGLLSCMKCGTVQDEPAAVNAQPAEPAAIDHARMSAARNIETASRQIGHDVARKFFAGRGEPPSVQLTEGQLATVVAINVEHAYLAMGDLRAQLAAALAERDSYRAGVENLNTLLDVSRGLLGVREDMFRAMLRERDAALADAGRLKAQITRWREATEHTCDRPNIKGPCELCKLQDDYDAEQPAATKETTP